MSCSFCLPFNSILEENTVDLMDEMLTEEGNAAMHYDEYDKVFERCVHDNACFNFML